MVTKNILAVFSLIIWNSMITDGFQTDLCDHGNFTKLERKLQTCMEEMDYSGDGGQDFCSPFQATRECLTSNLQECFIEDDVQSTTKKTLGALRKTITKVWLSPFYQTVNGFNKSEAEINSFFSDCPNIPNENFSEKGNKQLFVLGAGVRTDNDCNKEEIEEVNVGKSECVNSELEKAKSQLSIILSSTRGSYQTTICSVLDETMGNCLRKPFPACFSEREKSFMKTTMSKNLDYSLKIVDDKLFGSKLGIGSKLGRISFSECVIGKPRSA